MDLERLRDERVVSFLLRVMADPGESSEIPALEQLLNWEGY
jgi:hypothetical protein